MKVIQYLVQVIPSSGQRFHVYVGAYNRSSAYLAAQQLYPGATTVVVKAV